MTREEMITRLETAHGVDSSNYLFFMERLGTEEDESLYHKAFNLSEWDEYPEEIEG